MAKKIFCSSFYKTRRQFGVQFWRLFFVIMILSKTCACKVFLCFVLLDKGNTFKSSLLKTFLNTVFNVMLIISEFIISWHYFNSHLLFSMNIFSFCFHLSDYCGFKHFQIWCCSTKVNKNPKVGLANKKFFFREAVKKNLLPLCGRYFYSLKLKECILPIWRGLLDACMKFNALKWTACVITNNYSNVRMASGKQNRF